MAKARSTVIDRCGDEHGDLVRIGRKGSKYFIETIVPAWSSDAGKVTRSYMKKARATELFDRFCEGA